MVDHDDGRSGEWEHFGTRMCFGSNLLKTALWVRVEHSAWDPGAEGPRRTGTLRAAVSDEAEYRELQRFLTAVEPSMLRANIGNWHVWHLNDDHNPLESFPKPVTFRICEVPRPAG